MKNPGARKLLRALHDLYVVGGAVRNFVLGLPVKDIDFATPLLPGEVVARLLASGIVPGTRNVKFGIATAEIEGEEFEIATFRRDIYARPRYPKVEFVKTAKEDSKRRDFTMNALYMDARGDILDYAGGLGDIEKRIIRFVGPAETSVKRDPLRILRYFRFCGEYFHEHFDPEALEACRANMESVNTLPRKKITEEIEKLKASQGLAKVLAAAPYMEACL